MSFFPAQQMEHLPFDYDLESFTSSLSEDQFDGDLLNFPTDVVDESLTLSPMHKKKRGHRRSSSDPFPMNSQFSIEASNLGDVEMSNIFETSDFAGLIAVPGATPSMPPRFETPRVPDETFRQAPFTLVSHPVPIMGTVKDYANFDSPVTQAGISLVKPTISTNNGPEVDQNSESSFSTSGYKNPRSKGYLCGRCGQPKRGHVCPAINRKVSSMGTQIDVVNPAQERILIARPRSIL